MRSRWGEEKMYQNNYIPSFEHIDLLVCWKSNHTVTCWQLIFAMISYLPTRTLQCSRRLLGVRYERPLVKCFSGDLHLSGFDPSQSVWQDVFPLPDTQHHKPTCFQCTGFPTTARRHDPHWSWSNPTHSGRTALHHVFHVKQHIIRYLLHLTLTLMSTWFVVRWLVLLVSDALIEENATPSNREYYFKGDRLS